MNLSLLIPEHILLNMLISVEIKTLAHTYFFQYNGEFAVTKSYLEFNKHDKHHENQTGTMLPCLGSLISTLNILAKNFSQWIWASKH